MVGWSRVKILKILLLLALVLVLLIGGCAARAWQRDEAAKRFCLSMIPKIEEARAQRRGLYPSQADPAWWAGDKLPVLIHPERFYVNRGGRFGFWFQNDGWLMDNVWDFDSGSQTWSSYDANFEE